jgi:hypothetical protein
MNREVYQGQLGWGQEVEDVKRQWAVMNGPPSKWRYGHAMVEAKSEKATGGNSSHRVCSNAFPPTRKDRSICPMADQGRMASEGCTDFHKHSRDGNNWSFLEGIGNWSRDVFTALHPLDPIG